MLSSTQLLNLSSAAAAERGEACFQKYSKKIELELYRPGTQTAAALEKISSCFRVYQLGDVLKKLFVPYYVLELPFQVGYDLFCSTCSLAQIALHPVSFANDVLYRSSYGGTLLLLSYLEAMAQEVDRSQPSLLPFSRSYGALVRLSIFEELANTAGLEEKDYPRFVGTLLKEYQEGDFFCGGDGPDGLIPTAELLQHEF